MDACRLERFQSLIGRLKTAPDTELHHLLQWFQSLIGRLKTAMRSASVSVPMTFQSLIGRLKTVECFRVRVQYQAVSIPHR